MQKSSTFQNDLTNNFLNINSILCYVVIVTDGRYQATARLIVHVDDVNDNDPDFLQPFFVFSIKEGSSTPPSGERFVGSVTAQDKDAGIAPIVTYKFVNGKFS